MESGEGYEEGYLDGNPTDVTRAYCEFVSCIRDKITRVEASDWTKLYSRQDPEVIKINLPWDHPTIWTKLFVKMHLCSFHLEVPYRFIGGLHSLKRTPFRSS